MFGPWIEIWTFVKGLWPGSSGWRFPRLNFIIIHYIYMISLSIIGSVILFAGGGLAYVDSLFFAAGAATQSGLNTVNVNDLFLYQQIVLMLIACIGNPIFINTFVVFVRLYWFEKRFQKVVLEAQKFRRTRTKERSRASSFAKHEHDVSAEEHGVGNLKITVVRPGHDSGLMADAKLKALNSPDSEESSSHSASNSSSHPDRTKQDGNLSNAPNEPSEKPVLRREITFGDEITPLQRVSSDFQRLPVQIPAAEHIAFLENQRNPKDSDTLYIPGPRDFDRGFVPHQISKPRSSDDEDRPSESTPMTPQGTNTIEQHGEDNDDAITPLGRGNQHIHFNELTSPTAAKHEQAKIEQPASEPIRHGINFLRHRNTNNSEKESRPPSLKKSDRAATFRSFLSTRSEDEDPMPYLSWQPTIGRNSAFIVLDEVQREELGGIEYRALKLLALILVLYYVGFHTFGLVSLLPWIKNSKRYSDIIRSDGLNPGWWGVFTPASMFNDLGLTLTPDSMYSFNNAIWPLLLGSFLIIIGNTGFPIMLRFVIWVTSKFVPRGSAVWEELRFLLDHPRRCFTLLFPSKASWWLFWILVLLNGIDLLFFIILDLHDKVVTQLSVGIRILDGWFQAASTRTAGFAVVNLAALHPGIQVSYLVMMYISVFPIAISVRRTNVYEEKSLGIWAGDEEDEGGGEQSYVGSHLRRQLSFDLWYVFLGLFLVCIIEGTRIQNRNDYAFTIFSILFEIVSAYGTVGLSLGYPGIDASFSAEFSTLSKLIVIAMMIRGRHRGLPYALDRAILLPSESLNRKEQAEAERRLQRRGSNLSEIDREEHNLASQRSGAQLQRTRSTRRESADDHGQKEPEVGLWRLISAALTAGPAKGPRRT